MVFFLSKLISSKNPDEMDQLQFPNVNCELNLTDCITLLH